MFRKCVVICTEAYLCAWQIMALATRPISHQQRAYVTLSVHLPILSQLDVRNEAV